MKGVVGELEDLVLNQEEHCKAYIVCYLCSCQVGGRIVVE